MTAARTTRARWRSSSSHATRIKGFSSFLTRTRDLPQAATRVFARAVGEFILPLDSDDKMDPTMIQACVDRMMRDSSVAIVAVDVQEFGDSNKTLSCGNPVLERVRAIENQINYCSLFRRTLWEQVGGYRSNMRWGYEDWDFWISCL